MKSEPNIRSFRESFVNNLSYINGKYSLDGDVPCAWIKTDSQYACSVDIQAASPMELEEIIEFLEKLKMICIKNFLGIKIDE